MAFDNTDLDKQFAEGGAAAQATVDTDRKNAAYNVLRGIYGNVAGDPDTATKVQNYLQSTQMDPLLVQKQQLENAGTVTSNAQAGENLTFSQAVDPLKIAGAQNEVDQGTVKTQQDQLDLDTNRQLDPLKVQQQGLTNDTARLTNAAGASELATASAGRERQAALGIVSALQDTANSGGDIGAAFDQYASQIAAFENVDPAHLAPLKQLLLKDPQGTINKIQTALAVANPATTGAHGAAGGGAPANPILAKSQQVQAMQFIADRDAAVPGTIDSALALLPRMSTLAAIRVAQAEIPGTPEYQFANYVKQINANLSLDDLRTLRQTGFTLGRTNMAEFAGGASAVANLNPGQDTSTLAASLNRVKATYTQMSADMRGDIGRLRSSIPTAPSAPLKPTGGMSYGAVTNFLQNTYGVKPSDITSEGRPVGKNAAVNGVPGSAHTQMNSDGTLGKALDFTPKTPNGQRWTQSDLNAFAADLDKRGIPHTELFIESKNSPHSTGWHVHWGWAPKNGQPGGDSAINDADLLKKYGL